MGLAMVPEAAQPTLTRAVVDQPPSFGHAPSRADIDGYIPEQTLGHYPSHDLQETTTDDTPEEKLRS